MAANLVRKQRGNHELVGIVTYNRILRRLFAFVLELEFLMPCRDAAARRAMYLMCARARHNLLLVCGQERPSQEAKASLPGLDVLEHS